MANSNVNVNELATRLEGHAAVRARLAIVADTDGWRLHHGEITLGSDDPLTERCWSYASAVFLELPLPGLTAAGLLRGEPHDIAGIQVAAPLQPGASASAKRLHGQQEWGMVTTPWPRTEWTILRQDHHQEEDVLVGDGPTHLNFDSAFNSFFYQRPRDSRLARSDVWRIVLPQRDAWFLHIAIAPDTVTATITGNALDGVVLELTEPADHHAQPINGPGTYEIPLPNGLAPDSLLVLRRGDQWLDQRYFPPPVYGGARDASVVWEQPGPELDVLLATGEGPYLELKREIPQQGESRKKLLKTISAFASQDGGTLLIGIEDDLHIVGLDAQISDDDAKLRVTQMIRNCIEPDPPYTLRVIDHDGHRVLAIEVSAGGQPHAFRSGERLEFYVRRGPNTVPARHNEIAAGFQPKQQRTRTF